MLHSEHVISRSGIAVSPRERIRGFHTLCSSERWRRVSFNHRLWEKALFVIKHNAIKPIASRYGLVGPECTPAKGRIQTFIKLNELVYSLVEESCIKRLAGTCHTLQAWEIRNHAGEVQGIRSILHNMSVRTVGEERSQHHLLRLLCKCYGRLLSQRNRRAPEPCNYLKSLAARALLSSINVIFSLTT